MVRTVIAILAAATCLGLGWSSGYGYGEEMGARSAYQRFIASYRCPQPPVPK